MATRSRVNWFDPKKGFGFIEGPSGHDVFVHFSQIRGEGFRSLKDGEEVEYVIEIITMSQTIIPFDEFLGLV